MGIGYHSSRKGAMSGKRGREKNEVPRFELLQDPGEEVSTPGGTKKRLEERWDNARMPPREKCNESVKFWRQTLPQWGGIRLLSAHAGENTTETLVWWLRAPHFKKI